MSRLPMVWTDAMGNAIPAGNGPVGTTHGPAWRAGDEETARLLVPEILRWLVANRSRTPRWTCADPTQSFPAGLVDFTPELALYNKALVIYIAERLTAMNRRTRTIVFLVAFEHAKEAAIHGWVTFVRLRKQLTKDALEQKYRCN